MDNPRERIRLRVRGFGHCFVPTDGNNHLRTATTITVVAVWVSLSLGLVPYDLSGTPYLAITMLVFLILGAQWEYETLRIGQYSVSKSDEDDNGGE